MDFVLICGGFGVILRQNERILQNFTNKFVFFNFFYYLCGLNCALKKFVDAIV